MTKDDIIRMAQESWVFSEAHIPNILEFANLVAAAEREACAKVCEELGYTKHGGWTCAEEIRARGQE